MDALGPSSPSCGPVTNSFTDGGFDCMAANAELEVKRRGDGELYVDCASDGGHCLDGQLSDEDQDSLVGLWKAKQRAA